MKKLRGIMAILAATALIFGTVACSGGDDNNNNNPKPTDQSDPISGGGGSGESDPISGGGGSEGGDEGGDTEVSYKWSFNEDTFDVSKFITVQNSNGADKYGLAEDYEYASTPSGMVMTLKAAAGGADHYNLVDKTKTIGSSTVYYGTATVGCIEPNGDLVVLKNVQGPFTVTAYVQCNSSSDKTDRYGYIKIGEEEFADASYKASTTLPAAGQVLTAKYDSSDKVDVVIGCAKIMRIYDVVVTTAAAQDQSTTETNAGSMTISADKTSAKVGSKVTWTLTANNMDVPSTVDIYVDSSSTPFITGAALTDGKYEMTVKEAWLETDEDDDPIETTVKVFVKSGNVSSNKVTITFVPADETTVYSDLTVAHFESDFTVAELTYLDSMSEAEIESYIAGVYTDATCETPVTEGYEGDIWIKLNKTKDELKALIDAAIAAATKYTVTFDANGGAFAAGATTSVEVVSGLTVSTEQLATISEPAKTDYTFLGWATTADATEAADLSTVTISDATTLYAVWKSNIVTAVWDWEGTTKPIVAETADATTSVTLQSGKTGFATVNAGGNAVSIVVAATGKLSNRDSDAQFNNGTVLKVPVSAGSVVSVKLKTSDFTVNGVKAQAAETTYSAATAAGYVEIKATAGTYIYKISVTGLNVTDDFSNQATLTAVPVTGLTLSETEALNKSVGDSIALTATTSPTNRTSKVVWTVEGDAVTIESQDDLEAKFIAAAAGSATIKATCDEQVATLTVNVAAADPNSFTVSYFGEATDLNATISKEGAVTATAPSVTVTSPLEYTTELNMTTNGYGELVATASDKANAGAGADLTTVSVTITAGTSAVKLTGFDASWYENATGDIKFELRNGGTVLATQNVDSKKYTTFDHTTANAGLFATPIDLSAGSSVTLDIVMSSKDSKTLKKAVTERLYSFVVYGTVVTE